MIFDYKKSCFYSVIRKIWNKFHGKEQNLIILSIDEILLFWYAIGTFQLWREEEEYDGMCVHLADPHGDLFDR